MLKKYLKEAENASADILYTDLNDPDPVVFIMPILLPLLSFQYSILHFLLFNFVLQIRSDNLINTSNPHESQYVFVA